MTAQEHLKEFADSQRISFAGLSFFAHLSRFITQKAEYDPDAAERVWKKIKCLSDEDIAECREDYLQDRARILPPRMGCLRVHRIYHLEDNGTLSVREWSE